MIDDVSPDSRLPLIGRAPELRRIGGLLGLGGGARSDVILGGDAGVGKSRLIRELSVQASAAGWRVLTGHCLDFGDSALPYLPFSEALGRLAAEEPEVAKGLVEPSPGIARLLPAHRMLADTTSLAEPTDRAALFDSIYSTLEKLAGVAPTLLVVEDVHWADQSTRELLTFLFTRQFVAPVAVIATYRSDDMHRRHPLRSTLGEWGRLAGVTRIQLDPLTVAEMRQLVKALHPAPISEMDVRQIVERAEGNPFFVEELVSAAELGSGRLPLGLADLMLIHLDQLDDDSRLAVRAIAALGRRASHDLLARGVGLRGEILDRALRGAVEANVLVSVGDDAYAFRHALLAEAVYEDLLPGERVRLHATYANALASHEVEGSAAELARHARAAHDLVTATTASVQAGHEAMAVGGPDEAARHFELALELFADPEVAAAAAADLGDLDQVGLAILASEAAAAAGHLFRAIAIAQHQLKQLPPGSPSFDRARLLHAVASLGLLTDGHLDVLGLSTEALQLVADDPPSALQARVFAVHARANVDRARDDDATRWAARALSLARQLGLNDVAADAATTMARLDMRVGNPKVPEAALVEAVGTAQSAGDVAAELRGLFNLGSLHYEQGNLPQAADWFQRTWDRATVAGRPWAPWGFDGRAMVAIVAYDRGDWRLTEDTTDVAGESPPGLAAALLEAIRLEVLAARGEAPTPESLARLRSWWERDGMIAVISASAMLDVIAQQDDIAAVEAVYDDVVTCVGALWQRPDFEARIRLAALLLGHLASAVTSGGIAERQELHRRGEALAAATAQVAAASLSHGRRRGPESQAWLARVTAEHLRLCWLSGMAVVPEEDLIAAWRTTVSCFERLGHVYETARSRTRLAAVLHATGNLVEATDQIRAARQVAVELRAEPLLGELTALSGPDVRAGQGPGSRRGQALTTREYEVLALVAEGRSNREIAQRLYISAKTVSVHVSNILAKLGAAGRTEAVAVARRERLLADGPPD